MDSVKVDMSAIAAEQAHVERFDMGEGRYVEQHGTDRLVVGAKDPAEADEVVAAWQKEMERRMQEAQEAELRAKEAAEAAARERAEQLARERAEQQRRQEEAQAREEQRRQEEQARREREEQQRLEREEEERRREAERLALEREERERKQAVDTFCRQHGFEGINMPRRSGCSVWGAATSYPLHVAAELADASMVEMLLKEGADPAIRNSAGKTAAQVVQRKAKGGSHDAVKRLLAGPTMPRVGGA